jgi:hypothetical protein
MKIRNDITIVMAYYENAGMLRRHLLEWIQYPQEFKDRLRAVIVDDGSPDNPASVYIQQMLDVGFPVDLFRIKADIPWNQDGARNLAMTHADGWCLLTDMDHLLSGDQLPALFDLKLKADKHYIPLRRKAVTLEPSKRHPNTYVINSDLYWKIGGFDEFYAGYYGTDSTFRKRLQIVSKCIELENMTMTLFGMDVIADASTVAYGRKGSEYHVSQNMEMNIRKKQCPHPIKPLNFKWERIL